MNTDLSIAEQISSVAHLVKTKSYPFNVDQQKAGVPYFADLVDRQVFEYIYNNTRCVVDQQNDVVIKLKELPFKSLTIDQFKTISYTSNTTYTGHTGIDDGATQTIATLVSDEIIYPFLLFINGYFVSWNEITIISTQGRYYLKVTTTSSTKHTAILSATNVKVLVLPFKVIYTDNSQINYNDDYTIFSFDADGKLSFDTLPYTSVFYQGTKIKFKDIVKNVTTVPATKIDTSWASKTYEFTSTNFITFSNSLLTDNANLTVLGSWIGVNAGATLTNPCTVKFFCNTKGSESIESDSKLGNTYIQEAITSSTIPDTIKTKSTLTYTNTTAEEYLTSLITSISKFDNSLLKDIYSGIANVEVVTKTGQWAIDNATLHSGTIIIPRRQKEMVDCYCIMLLNGELYENYYLHQYEYNKIEIPVGAIAATDIIEFMFFNSVNNNEYETTINLGDSFADVNSDIINDDLMIFCNTYNGASFSYPASGYQNFSVSYYIEYNSSGQYRIRFNDSYYYGKTVTLAYRNRFKYCRYNISTSNATDYKVNLGSYFKYCPDYGSYLVFLDGKRLSNDQYRLTVPSRPTTPFYEYTLYSTAPLNASAGTSKLDIFYVPGWTKDVIFSSSIPTSGYIKIDKTNLSYGLSRDLYTIWLNGKKVPYDHLKDISSNQIAITHDESSIYSLAITKHVDDTQTALTLLNNAFKNNISTWDTFVNSMDETNIYTALGITAPTITGTDNVYANSYTITSVMKELIRDYYLSNALVDVTGPFIYGYSDIDSSIVNGTDSSGNLILEAFDGNDTDNLTIDRTT